MAVEGCHSSHLGNPGSPVVNCLSKKMCSHVFWHSVVICHNSTLQLFVTVIFLMAVLDIPCKMQMLIFFFFFSGQNMGSEVSSGPKLQFPCGDRGRMNLFSCGP